MAKIVLVDDELTMVQMVAEVLRGEGHEVFPFTSPAGVPEALVERQPDLVDKMAVKVLNPEIENVKIVHTNTQKPIEGFPVEIMGPPVAEGVLIEWCKNHLDKLDEDLLNIALLQVATKTLKKNGFNLEKHRLHKSSVYRLTANNLISEGAKVIKEE